MKKGFTPMKKTTHVTKSETSGSPKSLKLLGIKGRSELANSTETQF